MFKSFSRRFKFHDLVLKSIPSSIGAFGRDSNAGVGIYRNIPFFFPPCYTIFDLAFVKAPKLKAARALAAHPHRPFLAKSNTEESGQPATQTEGAQ